MSKTCIEPVRAAGPVRRALSGPTMGARWSALAVLPAGFDERALEAALRRAVERVDDQMSTWKPDSDLNRLNAATIHEWVAIPAELATVLAEAMAIGEASDGLFDIGVGEVVAAWGFGFGRREPDAADIATVAWPALRPLRLLEVDVDRNRVRKLAPARLDLSGIAKGFGVDELARIMTEFGVESWLVGIDGEMRAHGRKPDGRPWAIGHERPDPERRDVMGVLELEDAAVATSGVYRHVHKVGARNASHTVDPRTGEPLAGDLASVTVIAPTCASADALATALLVAGRQRGAAMAERLGVRALFVGEDGAVLEVA